MSEKILKRIEIIVKETTPDGEKVVQTEERGVRPFRPCFADGSFSDFIAAVRNGWYKQLYKPGDKRVITLKNGEKITIAIAGIDHDVNKEGEVLPITLTFVDCLAKEHRMNEECTNRGGWKACEMRKYMKEVFALLPDEWQAVVAPVWKVDTQCEDTLFLLSEYEVFGKNIYSKHIDGEKQYPFYADKYNRIKFSTACDDYSWWYGLRSPLSGNSNRFCFVNSTGNANTNDASTRRGVAPCFAIK